MRNIDQLGLHLEELRGMVDEFEATCRPQPSTFAEVGLLVTRYGTARAVRDCCAASPEHYFPTPQTFLGWMTDPSTQGPIPPVFVDFVTKHVNGTFREGPDAS
nr:hypothetical protein [uncultured Cohaesibacter sp.]